LLDLFALHGFTQRAAAFEELEWYLQVPVTAPDLPGHGEEPLRSWEETIDWISDLVAAHPAPPILAGYSMGGRLALGVAVERPESISGLIMMSAAPGIADAASRSARLKADRALADRIESDGVDAFLDTWVSLPMFGGLNGRGESWRRADRAMRSTNTAAGLAGALRGLGQGIQPDYRPRLGDLAVPTLLIAGEHDERYCAMTADMAQSIPDASTAIVRDAGHPVVGERPEAVAEVILAWA
jgi:2-succinyl-6-hydroxy-2,4-cyclohexadiene-1-carboxylate synthase